MLLEPQLLIKYKEENIIEEVYFLTNLESTSNKFLNSKNYRYYNTLKNNNKFIIEEYKIINYHLLLTLNINEIVGEIRNLLNIQNSILPYSLISNLYFYYGNEDEIFNPFKKKSITTKSNEDSLFTLFENIDNVIICFVENTLSTSNKIIIENSFYGLYNKNIFFYVDQILKNIYKNNYSLYIEDNHTISYNYDDIDKFLFILKDNNNYKIQYQNIINDIYIYNKALTYIDNEYEFVVYIFTLDDILIFEINNNNLIINDNKAWNELYSQYKDLILIKNKKIYYKTIVSFDIILNFILNLNINFDFLIIPSDKTKNIYKDRNKIYNIITSKNHISFKNKIKYNNIEKYITLFILGYNNIYNPVKLFTNNKINNLYISRFCQNSKNIIRKPLIVDNVDLNNYTEKYRDFYIPNDYKNNGDIYKMSDNIYYVCIGEKKHIGFLPNIYNYAKQCIPCCYDSLKYDNVIFKKCIGENKNSSNILLSPFLNINDKLKPIYNDKKLSKLDDVYDRFLNKYSKINLIVNRIETCENYIVYKKYDYINNIYNNKELLQFYYQLDNNTYPIIFTDSGVFVSKILFKEEYNKYKVFILIKNKIHEIISISKKKTGKLQVTNIPDNVYDLILEKYKSKFDDKKIDYKNIQINYNTIYLNNKILENSINTFSLFRYTFKNIPYNLNNIICENIEEYKNIININI